MSTISCIRLATKDMSPSRLQDHLRWAAAWLGRLSLLNRQSAGEPSPAMEAACCSVLDTELSRPFQPMLKHL